MEQRIRARYHNQRRSLLGGFCAIRNFHAAQRPLSASRAAQEYPIHLMRRLVFHCRHDVLRLRVGNFSKFVLLNRRQADLSPRLIWPRAVPILYPELAPDVQRTYAGLVVTCFAFGQMAGPFCTNWIPAKPFIIVGSIISLPLLTALAADPMNIDMTLAFLITGNFILGAADGVALPMTTFPLRTQEEIGTAGGLSGSIRLTGTSIAVAIYSTILNNRLEITVPRSVGSAIQNANLPESVVPTIIAVLDRGERLLNTTAQGLTADNIPLIEHAFRLGNSEAYRTVFLSTLGFGVLSVVLVWFIGGVDESDPHYVASQIAAPAPSDEKSNAETSV